MYLQSISCRKPEESQRYISRDTITMKKISQVTRISLRTLYRRFDELELGGYLTRDDKNIILPVPSQFFLVPQETLEYMFLNLNMESNIFKIYAWIGCRNQIHPNNVIFTQNYMLDEVLGENSRSQAAQRKFKLNVDILIKLGLINIKKVKTAKGNLVCQVTHFSSTIVIDDNLK